MSACWQLNDLLGELLPAQRIAALRDYPEANRAAWQAALADLADRDPTALALIENLGADHTPKSRQPTEAMPEPYRAQLLLISQGDQIHVRLLHVPGGGEPHAVVERPYAEKDLSVVLKALLTRSGQPITFEVDEWRTLERLKLATDGWLHPRLLELVGEQLHGVLFAQGVGERLRAAIATARPQRATLHLELMLDAESVALSQYPWELLKDASQALLPARIVELTRYIAFDKPPTPLRLGRSLRILYVAPRPHDLAALPPRADLGPLQQALAAQAEIIAPECGTKAALRHALDQWQPDILHFDGHGSIFRLCQKPGCATRNRPYREACARCGTTLTHDPPRGRLAFEQPGGTTDWVDSYWLSSLLSGSTVQLAVLLACLSGAVVRLSLTPLMSKQQLIDAIANDPQLRTMLAEQARAFVRGDDNLA